jgi:hypothetical protein
MRLLGGVFKPTIVLSELHAPLTDRQNAAGTLQFAATTPHAMLADVKAFSQLSRAR